MVGGHPGVIDAGHGCIPLGSPRYLGILCPNSNTFSDVSWPARPTLAF